MIPCIKFLSAIALAFASVLSSASAFASTSTLTIDAQNIASFSSTIAPGATTFSDLFTFTTTALSGGASAIASFNGTSFSTSFSAFNLVDVTNSNSVIATGTIGPSFVSQLTFSGLNPASTYGLNIVGTVTNPGVGGYYIGSMSVNPIPEPGEYALLFIGLGLIAFIASHRRQKRLVA